VAVAVAEAAVVSSALYCSRHVMGYAYSNEKEVVEYVAKMVPLLCLSVSVDSLLGVLSGYFLTSIAGNFIHCPYNAKVI
jgi:MATE family multidrug resistance protein